jgi:mono/diheme cytochrome c family protein
MKVRVLVAYVVLSAAGCHRVSKRVPVASAFGTAIVGVSDATETAAMGALTDRPLVVQVNDPDGNGVAGAQVQFSGTGGIQIEYSTGLTGPDGQFTRKVQAGTSSGRYFVTAMTRDKSGGPLQTVFTVIALDYQQTLGRELSEKHCSRCHDSQSTAERVSNHDNLRAVPHAFSDGATLNAISSANLIAIVAHGGAALGRSAEMPPYSPTLSTKDIEAIASYIRAVEDPAAR